MNDPEGYLVVETDPEHHDLVRVRSTLESPVPPGGSPLGERPSRICYVAFFSALHVARMHAQTALRRQMVDAEAGLYRVDPVTAVAAVDAIDLRHQRLYLAPEIESDPRFRAQIAHRQRRHHLANRVWMAVGILAIIVLVLFAQIPVF